MSEHKEIENIATILNIDVEKIMEKTQTQFNEFGELFSLDLSGFYLTKLPKKIFSPFKKINLINLSFNKLSSLPDSLFDKNPALISVIAFSNELTSLPNTLFSKQAHIQQISFSKNKLTTLPEQFFKRTINLKKLYLAQNKLNSLPNSFFYLRNLMFIDLSENPLLDLEVIDHSKRYIDEMEIANFQSRNFPAERREIREKK